METKLTKTNKVFKTGAVRSSNTDKPRFDLIPIEPLKRLAHLYARGAKAYGERNWEKGMLVSRCYESMLRHAFQYGEGLHDEDHLAGVIFNAMAIMEFEGKCRFDLMDMSFHESAKTLSELTDEIRRTKKQKL